jgi:hypothetical protein
MTSMIFPFRRGRMAIEVGRAAFCALLCLWLAWRSFDPQFYDGRFGGEFGEIAAWLRTNPIWVRVATWLVVAPFFGFGVVVYVRRWTSGLAPLVLSKQGVTAFAGRGLEQPTIPWSSIRKMHTIHSFLLIKGEPLQRMPQQKGRLRTIIVQPFAIGETVASLQKKIRKYRASLPAPARRSPHS